MSTLSFAMLTNRRDEAAPGTSSDESKPGVSTYVDAVAALVPAEALTLHAAIIGYTTKITGQTTAITEPKLLAWSFWGLIVLAAILYIAPRLYSHKTDWWDALRILIPMIAFVVWTMLQRATAFDAAFPSLTEVPRTVIGLFIAVLLGLAAAGLSYQADQKPRPAP
jgi:hypothetical protein